MAYKTYTDLKTAIANWVADSGLDAYLDDIINLGEDRLAQDLRIRGIETDLSVSISSGVATVPSGLVDIKHARIDGTPTSPLEVKDTQWIYRKFPLRSSTTKPEFIGIDGSSFIFGPYPDSGYTVKGAYYFKPTALSSSNETNEWTDNAPDALLFAALSKTALFKASDSRIPLIEAEYQRIQKGYNKSDKRKLQRGARMTAS